MTFATLSIFNVIHISKTASKQCLGTGAISTQILPAKPNREITKIANRHNTKETYHLYQLLSRILAINECERWGGGGQVNTEDVTTQAAATTVCFCHI